MLDIGLEGITFDISFQIGGNKKDKSVNEKWDKNYRNNGKAQVHCNQVKDQT